MYQNNIEQFEIYTKSPVEAVRFVDADNLILLQKQEVSLYSINQLKITFSLQVDCQDPVTFRRMTSNDEIFYVVITKEGKIILLKVEKDGKIQLRTIKATQTLGFIQHSVSDDKLYFYEEQNKEIFYYQIVDSHLAKIKEQPVPQNFLDGLSVLRDCTIKNRTFLLAGVEGGSIIVLEVQQFKLKYFLKHTIEQDFDKQNGTPYIFDMLASVMGDNIEIISSMNYPQILIFTYNPDSNQMSHRYISVNNQLARAIKYLIPNGQSNLICTDLNSNFYQIDTSTSKVRRRHKVGNKPIQFIDGLDGKIYFEIIERLVISIQGNSIVLINMGVQD